VRHIAQQTTLRKTFFLSLSVNNIHKSVIDFLDHARWVSCHHSMSRPRVADGLGGHQLWMVATNIMNKQSRSADTGWLLSLGVGRGTNSPSPRRMNSALGKSGFFDKRPKLSCMNMRSGTWNMRRFFGISSLMTISKELCICNLDLVGTHEAIQNRAGTKPADQYIVCY
jgi:hypothetical protein